MSAFDDAAEALFADDNLAFDALWYTGGIGAGLAVRVLKAAPDETFQYGQSSAIASFARIRVLGSAIASPKRGDTVRITITGALFEIVAPPKRDPRGLSWMCDAVER